MKPFGKTLNMTVVFAVLVFLFMMPFFSSCSKEVEQPPDDIIETEDAHELLFNILSSENGYANGLGIQHIREFYTDGAPVAFFEQLAERPMVARLGLSVSADRAIFGSDDMYADFATTFLRDASLSIVSNRDPSSKTSYTNLDVSLSGQKLAGADIYIDSGELFCIKSEEMYPEYVALGYPDLLGIVSDAADTAALVNVSYDNLFMLQGKYLDLLGLMQTDSGQLESATAPIIEKLKDAIADENIVIEYDVPVSGVPGGLYKKVSVSLANDDLRQFLTALIQAAKENEALLALIKDKYSIIYENIMELTDLGANIDPQSIGLPPVEDIENFFQTSFAAFEVMLSASAGLPVKAVSFDLYLDGTVLKFVDIKAWTALPEPRPGGAGNNAAAGTAGAAGAAGQNASDGADGPTLPGSVHIVDSAGDPAIQIGAKSYGDSDGRRHDSLTVSFAGDGGETNVMSIVSVLADSGTATNAGGSGSAASGSGGAGGASTIDFTLEGPAFNRDIPNTTIDYSWNADVRALSIYGRIRGASGRETPIMRFDGELAVLQDEGGADASYGIIAELGLNDVSAFMAGQSTATASAATAAAGGGAVETAGAAEASGAAGAAEPGGSPAASDFAVSMRCEGSLQFGSADIPTLQESDYFLLVQDSFYDGTFETVFNEFFKNLIRFASANRQLLSLYGFPGF